ncbi:pseudaminic acid biosynthesis-associated methylase [Francisella philomiragia]|uniref:Pseudaminic acid biosynthesis-associated methylase n=1 Tax=Francisella philomiragia TaxID=28110 RepID=A0ABS1GCG5_9GAMM|nr:pseudaminic acid biosynthesis-associated methylase [Francisella philomiragia]MBK2258616.1 pseudaminic acid biosynthesis-associated methylase [Francisella philomiragia]MBK2302214.1 pseudaminic acid biosynthesis-associated methylase [Francisella philomiragia]
MKKFKTEQEAFWADPKWAVEYIKRNNQDIIKDNIKVFSDILSSTTNVSSVIEFGSNIGLNLHAINSLSQNMDISAIEISQDAVNELNKLEFVKTVYHESILDIQIDRQRDLSLIKGVLIHINPEFLELIYEKLYKFSSKYIVIAEYYNPTPVTISYRGNNERLFKRDFAGEMLDKYPDLELVDYKFHYHRDNNFPQDDITWFLLRKK